MITVSSQVPDYWKTYVQEVDTEREMWLNSFYKSPLRIPMPAELEYWWSKGMPFIYDPVFFAHILPVMDLISNLILIFDRALRVVCMKVLNILDSFPLRFKHLPEKLFICA